MSIELTAITKLRHAALWELSQRLGSQQAAAQQVGVCKSIFIRWSSLDSCFPKSPTKGWWTDERWTAVKGNLESLTSQTIEQLWPDELRKAIKLKAFIGQIEQTIEVPESALLEYAQFTADRLRLPLVEENAERTELHAALVERIKMLPYREREIIKMRYGLGSDRDASTLEEISHVFGVNRERIRQIEMKALRRLQQFSHMNALRGFLD